MKRPTRRTFLTTSLAAVLLATTVGAADARLSSRTSDRAAVINMIRQEARNMGVSVTLALAVAHAESYFNPKAESHKGARGVMQIMPATSRSEYGIHPDLLWDAGVP